MDLSKYNLKPATIDDEWDNFVQSSLQGTIFTESILLNTLKGRFGAWWCFKGTEKVACILLTETDDGKSTRLHPHLIHNGIIFARSPSKQNQAQILSEQFRISAFISAEITKHYQNVFMQLHYSIIDIRPFLWHNYGDQGDKYNVEIRYTSLLDLAGHDKKMDVQDSPIYLSANKSRRQEIRNAITSGCYTKENYDVELFLNLYQQTFKYQKINTSHLDLNEMGDLLNGLYKEQRIKMFVSYTAENEPGSVAIFAQDAKRWYYLFGASEPTLRNNFTGTLVLWDAFGELSESETSILDLEGVNSPKRGYFKLSFNGNLIPYYRVFLQTSDAVEIR